MICLRGSIVYGGLLLTSVKHSVGLSLIREFCFLGAISQLPLIF